MRRVIPTVLAVAFLFLTIASCSDASPDDQPDDSSPAPSWDLLTHIGDRLTSEGLIGKAYVVNFMWTNCRDTCPTISLQMALLQDRLHEEGLLGGEVVLVSMSFDNERDTPERLSKYADLFKAQPGGWYFLTGSSEELERVITLGFGVWFRAFTPDDTDESNLEDQLTPPFEETQSGLSLAEYIGGQHMSEFLEIDDSVDYDHQSAFVLVDAQGGIRSYYLGAFLDRDQVLADIKALP